MWKLESKVKKKSYFQIPLEIMPNRSCDFCLHQYRNEPEVGYYQLTDYMKVKLNLIEIEADVICGIHFDQSSFTENGRLKLNAVPSFFPSRVNMELDHPYSLGGDCEEEGEQHAHHEPPCEVGMYVSDKFMRLGDLGD